MEVSRKNLISILTDRLGARKLVWVGTRGHDAASLMELPQFSESYAIIAPLGSLSLAVDFALEEVSGRRVDLDTYKIDDDRSEPAQELRRRLLNSLTEPTVVLAYRPSALLSAICYPRREFVTYLGMFHERQATFEHKVWVENELRLCGIPIIPWRYFAEEDRQRLEEEIAAGGTLVIRANRSDGGAGVRAISKPEDIGEHISDAGDGFIAASPLLEPHISLNINACIFREGTISLHSPSMQLIGIRECTQRRFGYCGNDFAAIKDIDQELLFKFETLVRGAGQWLWSQGYLGAFGMDALIYNGKVLLTEINPRFQGSSSLSARIDRAMGRNDLFLCHLAAHLGFGAPTTRALIDIVKEQAGWAQMIFHNKSAEAVRVRCYGADSSKLDFELIPSSLIHVEPDATLFRVLAAEGITRNGCTIEPSILDSVLEALRPGESKIMRTFNERANRREASSGR